MSHTQTILGDEAEALLSHICSGIPKNTIHAPGPDYIERVVASKNRKPSVLRNLNAMYNTGRLAGTGYLSLLPVDGPALVAAPDTQQPLISSRSTTPLFREKFAVGKASARVDLIIAARSRELRANRFMAWGIR